MTVETATQFSQIDPALPAITDLKREAPQHFSLIKTLLKDYLGSIGPTVLTVTGAEINYLQGLSGNAQTLLNAKGDIAGQTWTGTHNYTAATLTAATQTAGDSSTKVATTAFVAGQAFSSALPAQTGNAKKFTTTDGSSASWAYPELEPQLISTDTTAVPGVHYIFAAACTLTLPTSWTARDVIAVSNASGLTTPIVDFGATNLRGSAPGSMTLDSLLARFKVVYSGNPTIGLVPA